MRGRGVPVLAAACWVALSIAPPAAGATAGLEGIPVPGVRLMGSIIWHVEPGRSAIGGLDILPHLTLLDVTEGLRLGFLAGYGFESGGDTHLAQLGAEVGFMPTWIYGVDVGLRALVGSSDGEAGGGLRVVTGLEFFLGAVRVEAAYQLLGSDRGVEHDLRLGVGVDLLRLVVVVAL